MKKEDKLFLYVEGKAIAEKIAKYCGDDIAKTISAELSDKVYKEMKKDIEKLFINDSKLIKRIASKAVELAEATMIRIIKQIARKTLKEYIDEKIRELEGVSPEVWVLDTEARTRHICSICLKTIEKGEKYFLVEGIGISNKRVCMRCYPQFVKYVKTLKSKIEK